MASPLLPSATFLDNISDEGNRIFEMADKQKKWNRTYVSSHSLFHLNWKANVPTRRHAGYRSRSEYICKLVEDDLKKAGVLKALPPGKRRLPRIVRGRKSSKNT